MKLSLTTLASIAFAELSEQAEQQGEEMFIQHRDAMLSFARSMSRKVLGEEASSHLDWTYTGTMDLPPNTEQATAQIDEGPAYLRYRIADEEVSFELVQPCGACGHDEINTVNSLATLGGLLDAAAWKAAEKAVAA